MRILLVEDDLSLSNALAASLRSASYTVDCVFNGQDALSTLAVDDTDLLILDLGLPDIDGLSVLKALRKNQNNLPVLVLTARDKTTDKIIGLDTGADDYLAKPFDMDELLARLRVLERRIGTSNNAVIQIAEVVMDTSCNGLEVDGKQAELSRREFMLLKSLMENAGRIQSKAQLESKLYEWGDEVASNTIEVHIHNLRKKMPNGFIKTVRGVGYSIHKPKDSADP